MRKRTPVVLGAMAAAAAATLAAGQRRLRSLNDLSADARSEPLERHCADVEGIRMAWTERGDGLPVVLLHGIPTSPDLWRKVMPHLSGARVLAWEMVGYGSSIPEGRGRDLSLAAQAEYLARWMRQLGLRKAVIAGHDLGGGVAQILAVRHRDLCGGLFLTNGVGYDSWPIPSVAAMRASAGLMRHLPDAALKLLLANMYARGHDDPSEAREAYAVHAAHYLEHGGAAALIRQIECLDARDTLAVADRLPALGIPARIVWGDADGFQKIEYGERFARDLNAPLRKIVGGRHFTPEDHPDIIAEEINQLIRTVVEQSRRG